jgi:UDP-N-acetylmuramoylalanine--D-glutamate ligase
MAEAVELSYQHTPKGRICLLSPAASSFNLFRDYKHRGDEFKKWIVQYGKKKRA